MNHRVVTGWMIAAAGLFGSFSACAGDAASSSTAAASMFECAAFYDAAAVEISRRPELAGTQFRVGNPGRASMLLFSTGSQIDGVQAGWAKYSALQKSMLATLEQSRAAFAQAVSKYDGPCMSIVEQAGRSHAPELAAMSN